MCGDKKNKNKGIASKDFLKDFFKRELFKVFLL